MRFDTHLHVWMRGDGSRVLIRERIAALDTNFRLQTLLPELDELGVDRVLLVSAAQDEAETARLLCLAHDWPARVAGVIGWLDLEAPGFRARLNAAAVDPAWLGLRLPLSVMDDARWITRPAVRDALTAIADTGGLAQILALPGQLPDVAAVLQTIPHLVALIDHAGNPRFDRPPESAWQQSLATLARRGRTWCKLSGFWAPGLAAPTDDVVQPFFDSVMRWFGPDRVVVGGNWPVASLLERYGAPWHRLDRLAARAGLGAATVTALRCGNAERLLLELRRRRRS